MIPTSKKMAENLRALGVHENGVLLVHASLRSLGKVEGGAEAIIKVLLDVLGASGTLLLPALSYETVKSCSLAAVLDRTHQCTPSKR